MTGVGAAETDRRHRWAAVLGLAGGALGVVAGIVQATVGPWIPARFFADDWFRVLLTALGGFEVLMAAGAAPLTMVAVGAVGGVALITAAWLRTAPRAVVVGLIAVGTVPFAALAWSAVVPLLLAVVVVVVAVPVVREGFSPLTAGRGEVR
jgi:hypothetical protein